MEINTIQGGESPIAKKESGRLSYWTQQIKLGLRYRQLFGRDDMWNTYKYHYRAYSRVGEVPVHLIYSVGRSLIPQLYFRNPKVSITPKKPGFSVQANILEQIDNYLINETGVKHQIKAQILDTYLCGRGPGILGYDSEFGFDIDHAAQEIEGTTTGFDNAGQQIEYNNMISPGMPWYQRCNPKDYVVPYGAYDAHTLPWFAFRVMRPLRDLKGDIKYKNTKDIKATYKTSITSTARFIAEDTYNEYVELWQIHDRRSGKVMVIALDHPHFLREDVDALQLEQLPTQVLGFNEDPDYFWWTPDARLLIAQQEEINDIRTMSRYHRRVAVLKILIDEDAVTKEEAEKILDGDVKALIRVKAGTSGDIRKAVALLQSHVPPELSMLSREVREDVREMVGFSRNQSGSFEESSGRRTAHEAEIVRAASMIRINERRDTVADLLTGILRTYNQIIFSQWSAKQIVPIVGNDGARYWVTFSGKDIKGEYTYGVNPEETMPTSSEVKKQEALQLIEMMKTTLGANMQYLLTTYAEQFSWLDAKLLFPREGAGNNPDQPVPMEELMRKMKGGGGMNGEG